MIASYGRAALAWRRWPIRQRVAMSGAPWLHKDRRTMSSLILTVIGSDRPGLVRTLAEAVAAHGGSWLESRMARLAGQFAGIVRVEAPDSLLADLRALEGQGLRIVVQSGDDSTAAAAPVPAPR